MLWLQTDAGSPPSGFHKPHTNLCLHPTELLSVRDAGKLVAVLIIGSRAALGGSSNESYFCKTHDCNISSLSCASQGKGFSWLDQKSEVFQKLGSRSFLNLLGNKVDSFRSISRHGTQTIKEQTNILVQLKMFLFLPLTNQNCLKQKCSKEGSDVTASLVHVLNRVLLV